MWMDVLHSLVHVAGAAVGVAVAIAAIPAVVLLVQVLAAGARLGPRHTGPRQGTDALSEAHVEAHSQVRERLGVTVLIPAHNEASGLPATLRSVGAQLRPGDRVLVVADNCTDATAEVARGMPFPITVVERSDAQQRGKGYALDFGVRTMQTWAKAPAVVLILDADCTLAAGSLEALSQAVARSGGPVQALNLMHAPAGASLKVRIAEFAWLVKNQVRPTGMRRLGLPCQLMGTGMAFPWSLLREAPLATDDLVEDIKLGCDLAGQGMAPVFCDAAAVHSEFPTHQAGLDSQRQRWERGHLSLIARQGLPLLRRGLAQGRLAVVAMAIDLCVPPLAALVASLLMLCALAALCGAISQMWWPLGVGLGALLVAASAVVLAWHRHARHVITAAEMAGIPAYIGAKLPIYLAALCGRPMTWVRTRRERE